MTLSGDYFFLSMAILAIFFTWFSGKRQGTLLAIVTSLLWFTIGMWLFFSNDSPIGLDESWKEVFVWVFVLLALVPWLLQMDIEIRHEANGHSWSTYGTEPKVSRPTAYEDYREKLYGRTRRGTRAREARRQ